MIMTSIFTFAVLIFSYQVREIQAMLMCSVISGPLITVAVLERLHPIITAMIWAASKHPNAISPNTKAFLLGDLHSGNHTLCFTCIMGIT